MEQGSSSPSMVTLKHIPPFSPQANDAEEMKVCKASEEQLNQLFSVQNLNTLSQVPSLGVWLGPVVKHKHGVRVQRMQVPAEGCSGACRPQTCSWTHMCGCAGSKQRSMALCCQWPRDAKGEGKSRGRCVALAVGFRVPLACLLVTPSSVVWLLCCREGMALRGTWTG